MSLLNHQDLLCRCHGRVTHASNIIEIIFNSSCFVTLHACQLFSILIFCFLLDFPLEKLNVSLNHQDKLCRCHGRVAHTSNIIEIIFKSSCFWTLYTYLFNLDIFSHIEDLLFEYVCRGCWWCQHSCS